MSRPERIVIVGGGLGGGSAVVALREQDYASELTLLAGEHELPYERPPLSKGYLAGESSFDDALVKPAAWYDEQNVDLRLGTRATAVDVAEQRVRLADGSDLAYDKLLLATGATPRVLSLPGADAEGVYTLRTHADSDALRATFGDGKRIAIVGAGWIGLEVAAAARNAGTTVTVVESAELPLLAVLGRELAEVFAGLHREHEVDLRLGAHLAEIVTRDGIARGLRLADGTVIDADSVVIGVGVQPDVALAETAGLRIENGVLVDASLRTSDDHVYAVGDIANHDHPILGERVRVEHWATALNQPKTAAAAMLGVDASYTELPYFFTDQYDLGMEYVGYVPRGVDAQIVIRGDKDGREFVAFWIDSGHRLLAAMNVNVWDIVDEVKPHVAARAVVDPKRLADPDVAYADLAEG